MKINEHWIILIFCLCLLNAQRILPTDYKEYDDYCTDDISEEQRYHHILMAYSFGSDYIDEYYGLYYKAQLKCGYYSNSI